MPAPTFVSSDPSNGATAVAKNTSIQVVLTEALAPATVSRKTVILRLVTLNEVVRTTVTLSADGETITIVPAAHLFPNSAYELLLVGTDVSTTVRITSADTSPLAVTIKLAFQTGDSLQANDEAGTKSEPELSPEGDAVLPDGIGFRPTVGSPLRLLQSDPKNHAFGIPTPTSRLRFRFSNTLSPDATGAVTVSTPTFFDEDDFRAIETDLGAGEGLKHYFRYETGYYDEAALGILSQALFADPDVQISVTGQWIYVDLTPVTGQVLPNNICIQVDFAGVTDEDDNELDRQITYICCTEPYPKWSSPLSVRGEIGAFASLDTPDDFIGLRVWQASIDLWMTLLQFPNLQTPNRYYQIYVRLRGALDLFDDLMAIKYLNSGVVKELGDLRIQYNTGAGGARPRKVRELEERLAKLELQLYGYWTQTPRTGIRSIADAYEPSRAYFRQRLWKAEIMSGLRLQGHAGRVSGNSAVERLSPPMWNGQALAVVNALDPGSDM